MSSASERMGSVASLSRASLGIVHVLLAILAVVAVGMMTPLLAQDTTVVRDTVVTGAGPVRGLADFLVNYGLVIATIGGSWVIWVLSHKWAWFNEISQSSDGGPSFIGTWAKRFATFAVTWLLFVIIGKMGAEPPAAMVATMGLFWSQFFSALGGAITSGTVFKMATSSPSKYSH